MYILFYRRLSLKTRYFPRSLTHYKFGLNRLEYDRKVVYNTLAAVIVMGLLELWGQET